ncbi:MAG: hypothetical protein LBK03_01340 [Bacteroidales bacterium]|jgi:hypothetical protein|nr:hypothetical protein [Bacteroidales bacterium]
MKPKFTLILVAVLLLSGCPRKESTGFLMLDMAFQFNGSDVAFSESAYYTNSAGNRISIGEVKCFISEVALVGQDGAVRPIAANEGIHYFDNALPATLSWTPADPVEAGNYKVLRFRFGLIDNQNTTGKFPNPPETNFAWPAMLGGGYHYMQINGKWLDGDEQKPLTLHTGRGQQRDSNDNITGFVDNSFVVELPLDHFKIQENQTGRLTLVMDIARWFDTPNLYDIARFGSAIMQNQEAQQALRENGVNVFTCNCPVRK